jgi:dephospho-CoA kinase
MKRSDLTCGLVGHKLKPLFVIGLTGLTGSGKTTVLRLLEGYGGFPVIADDLAHEVIKNGRPAYDEIIAVFGAGILNEAGEIDRRELGDAVFGQSEKMKMLENIIHPRVIGETEKKIAAAEGIFPFAVIDAPLLIEADMHNACDSVWLVSAPKAQRKARIIARDGLTEEAAEKRLASRQSEAGLVPHAHVVIHNDGSMEALSKAVDDAFRNLNYG